MLKPRIKVRLAELDRQQLKLAEELGINKQTLNGWVVGRNNPSLDNAFKLARLLDCKVDDLWEYVE